MKLVTYRSAGAFGPARRIGAVLGERVVDLVQAYALYLRDREGEGRPLAVAAARITDDMALFLEGGPGTLEAARVALAYREELGPGALGVGGASFDLPLADVQLLAPIPRPVALRDTLNSETHFRNALKRETLPDLFYERPFYYRTSHTNVGGPYDPIIWPPFGERLDYEVEMCAAIYKAGRDIAPERALEHVAGYVIFNDVSMREYQPTDMSTMLGPTKSKNFVNGNILGPYLVTADEVPDPHDLRMTARVNGEVWSDTSTRDMYFRFPDLIAYLSRAETVYPGELIASGTMAYGAGIELDRWLRPGDVLEIEIEGLGRQRNVVTRAEG